MSGLSEIQKLKIRTILIITILWMLFYSLLFIYEFSAYKIRFPELYASLNPGGEYGITMLGSFLAGIIGGSIFVYNINTQA